MQKNKVQILCTMNLPQPLIDKAAGNDVLIDALSFIHVKHLDNDKIQEEIIGLSRKSLAVIITSMSAADTVIDKLRLQPQKPDWKIYCISGTTEKIISEYFGHNAIAASANDAISLAEKIILDRAKELVFFCGNHRRDEIPTALAAQNISMKEIIVYETVLTPQAVSKKYDGILFFSPSAAKSFFSLNNPDKETVLFSIGNTTADSLKTYSRNKIVVGKSSGKEILIDTCVEYFQTNPIHY